MKAFPHSAQTWTRGPWVCRCLRIDELSLNNLEQPYIRTYIDIICIIITITQLVYSNARFYEIRASGESPHSCNKKLQHFIDIKSWDMLGINWEHNQNNENGRLHRWQRWDLWDLTVSYVDLFPPRHLKLFRDHAKPLKITDLDEVEFQAWFPVMKQCFECWVIIANLVRTWKWLNEVVFGL